jgi:TolA-binding protein
MAVKKGEEKSPNELSDMSNETEKVFDEAFKEGEGTSGSEKAIHTEENLEASTAGDKSATGTSGTQAEVTPKKESGASSTSGEDFEQKFKSLQGNFTQVNEENKTLKTQLDEMAGKIAEIEKLQQGSPADKKEAKEIKAELIKQLTDLYADLSDDEKAALATYDEEFDTVSKSEAKKREIFAKKIVAFINEAIENNGKVFLTQLAPFLLSSESAADEKHFTTLKSAHPNYEEYRDNGQLKAWIDKQPPYLKKALQAVYDEGETQDVIDLYSRFKKDNNIGTGTKKDDKKVDEVDPKKKENLESMEIVDSGTRPIGGTGVGKAEDYDGAFEEAIKKAGI